MQLIYIIIHNIPYLLTWFLASSLSLTLESLFFTPTHQQILKCEDRPLIYEIFHCSITLKSSPGVGTVTSVTADPSRGLRRASTHTHTHFVSCTGGCRLWKKKKKNQSSRSLCLTSLVSAHMLCLIRSYFKLQCVMWCSGPDSAACSFIDCF